MNRHMKKHKSHSPRKASSSTRVEVKPVDEDGRLYRGVILNNGMRAVVVSDPTVGLASVALNVAVGFFMDPDDLPGLAHLCMKMVQRGGCVKYPTFRQFQGFCHKHGGHCVTLVTGDYSGFGFSIAASQLRRALDMWSNYFTEPLFKKGMIDENIEEINEVIFNLDWKNRVEHLEDLFCVPGHPFRKHEWDEDTLMCNVDDDLFDLRSEMIAFHSKWFSPKLMYLCVTGKENLDILERMVTEIFGSMKNKVPPTRVWPNPFGPEQLKKRMYVSPCSCFESKRDVYRVLRCSFPVPDQSSNYKSSPGKYFSYLLSHEGPGSVSAALTEKGWTSIMRMKARCSTRACGVWTFIVEIGVNAEGLKHADDIITFMFQYLNMLREAGPQLKVLEEIKTLNQKHSAFRSHGIINEMMDLARNLMMYPMEDVAKISTMPDEWCPNHITQFLNYLTPDNMITTLVGEELSSVADCHDDMSEFKYKIENIPDKTLQMWKNAGCSEVFQLPVVDKEVTSEESCVSSDRTEGEVAEEDGDAPLMLEEAPNLRVWYKRENKFKDKRTCIRMKMSCSDVFSRPISYHMTAVTASLISSALNKVFSSEKSTFTFKVENHLSHIGFEMEGCNKRMDLMLGVLCEIVRTFKADQSSFKAEKSVFEFIHNKPLGLIFPGKACDLILGALMFPTASHSSDGFMGSLKDVTIEDINTFFPQILSKGHLEILIHGDLSEKRARRMSDIIGSFLMRSVDSVPPSRESLLPDRSIELKDGCSYLYNYTYPMKLQENEIKSAMLMFLQCGRQDENTASMVEILCPIIDVFLDVAKCSNEDRDGVYSISTKYGRMGEAGGIIIQATSVCSPQFMEDRVEAFLAYMTEALMKCSMGAFLNLRDSLVSHIDRESESLSQLTSRIWNEICYGNYEFHQVKLSHEFWRTVTVDHIRKFVEDFIHPSAPRRRKVVIYVQPSYMKQLKTNAKQYKGTFSGLFLLSSDIQPPKLMETENIKTFKDFHHSQNLARQVKVKNLSRFLVQAEDE